jgi:hypothetical protein
MTGRSTIISACPGGEAGRHSGLKIRRFPKGGVRVRSPSRAPKNVGRKNGLALRGRSLWWRRGPESNWALRICNPVHNRFATAPLNPGILAKKGSRSFPLQKTWSGRRGSNSRPQPWQGCALPTELLPHCHLLASLRTLLSVASCIIDRKSRPPANGGLDAGHQCFIRSPAAAGAPSVASGFGGSTFAGSSSGSG